MSPLSIVVLNWNQAETTLECLRRIEKWELTAPRVWVVDNASTDSSRARIRSEHPGARLVEAPGNLGFGGGNNLALRQIAPDDVLLLNNDAFILEHQLARLRATLERDPAAAIVGPVIYDAAQPTRLLAAGGRDIAIHVATHCRSSSKLRAAAEAGQPLDVDYVPGSIALIRGSALEQVGLLDEQYFFGGEMAAWCERARRAGWHVLLEPASSAFHDMGLSAEARRSLYPFYILRNRFLYVRQFYCWTRPLFLAGWIAYGLLVVCRAAVAGRGSDAKLLLRALIDGLLGRSGPLAARWAP